MVTHGSGSTEAGGPLKPPSVTRKVLGARTAGCPAEQRSPEPLPSVGSLAARGHSLGKRLKCAPALATLRPPGKPWFGSSRPFTSPTAQAPPRESPGSSPSSDDEWPLRDPGGQRTKSYPPCFPTLPFISPYQRCSPQIPRY